MLINVQPIWDMAAEGLRWNGEQLAPPPPSPAGDDRTVLLARRRRARGARGRRAWLPSRARRSGHVSAAVTKWVPHFRSYRIDAVCTRYGVSTVVIQTHTMKCLRCYRTVTGFVPTHVLRRFNVMIEGVSRGTVQGGKIVEGYAMD